VSIPDILRFYCDDISFLGEVSLKEDFLNSFKERFRLDKTKKINVINRQLYNIGKNEYYLRLGFNEKQTKKDTFNCNINFRISTEKPRGLSMEGDVIKLLEFLTKEKPKAIFAVNTSFYYSTEKFNSLIALPFKLPSSNLRDVEVQGLRLGLNDKKIGNYSHVIDLWERIFLHKITIDHEEIILSSSIINDLLQQSFDLSTKLIEEKK